MEKNVFFGKFLLAWLALSAAARAEDVDAIAGANDVQGAKSDDAYVRQVAAKTYR